MTTTIVRRHNPYLALSCSFDGSLSTSLDKCVHPQPRHAPPPAAAAGGDVAHTLSGHTTTESSAQVSAIGSSDGYDTTGDFDVQSVSSATAPQTPTTHLTKGSRRRSAFSFNATDMTTLLGHYDAPVDLPCPGGSIVKAYNGDISQHFNIPSECVLVTRGSIKYADHLERFGVQMRFRFQLCHNFLRHSCPRKSECSYIHATSLPSPSEVHLNPFTPRRFRRGGSTNAAADQQDVPLAAQDDPRVADSYETLPPGMTLSVYPPNDKGTMEPQKIPSELILVTAGSVSAKRGADAHVRHCAHYQFRRLCHQGTRCNFIHSKVPFAQHPALCKASPSPSLDGCPSP